MSSTSLPKHVAVIMDGNGRWAEKRLLPRVSGHYRGVQAAKDIVKLSIDANIAVLTLFAFSSENWERPAAEVRALMNLLRTTLTEELSKLHKNAVKFHVIGDLSPLSTELQAAILQAEQDTKHNQGLRLNIAFNYGGRWDIIQAARQLCSRVGDGKLAINEIDESVFGQYLSLADCPEPDLLIRTSGEQRISNFLLWQLAYAEIYFTNTLWPDFGEQDFQQAIAFYADRQRRFGKIVC